MLPPPCSAEALGKLLLSKEEEWRALLAQRTQLQEVALQEAQHQLEKAREKLQRLQEDFVYNLQVLEERDQELERYQAALLQARAREEARQAEASELKIEVAKLRQELAREGRRAEELQEQQRLRLQEHHLELERLHSDKNSEMDRQREQYEDLKWKLERKLAELDGELSLQRQELLLEFQHEMQKREHEFRLRADSMSNTVLSHELKVKLLNKELEALQKTGAQAAECLQRAEVANAELERTLQGHAKELQDLEAVKDARIKDLEGELCSVQQAWRKDKATFTRKHEELDRLARERDAALVALKSAHAEQLRAVESRVQGLQAHCDGMEAQLRGAERTRAEAARDRGAVISRLREEAAALKAGWDAQVAQMSKEAVAGDLQVQALQEEEAKLKAQLTRTQQDADRYKQQLSQAVERERSLERERVQLGLDWQRRCDDIEREQIQRSEALIQGLTEARDQVAAKLQEAERALREQEVVLKAVALERDQAVEGLHAQGLLPGQEPQQREGEMRHFPSEEIQQLQEQNASLRSAVALMRREMEVLSHQMPPPAQLGKEATDAQLPSAPPRADAAPGYVLALEAEVQDLKHKLMGLEEQLATMPDPKRTPWGHPDSSGPVGEGPRSIPVTSSWSSPAPREQHRGGEGAACPAQHAAPLCPKPPHPCGEMTSKSNVDETIHVGSKNGCSEPSAGGPGSGGYGYFEVRALAVDVMSIGFRELKGSGWVPKLGRRPMPWPTAHAPCSRFHTGASPREVAAMTSSVAYHHRTTGQRPSAIFLPPYCCPVDPMPWRSAPCHSAALLTATLAHADSALPTPSTGSVAPPAPLQQPWTQPRPSFWKTYGLFLLQCISTLKRGKKIAVLNSVETTRGKNAFPEYSSAQRLWAPTPVQRMVEDPVLAGQAATGLALWKLGERTRLLNLLVTQLKRKMRQKPLELVTVQRELPREIDQLHLEVLELQKQVAELHQHLRAALKEEGESWGRELLGTEGLTEEQPMGAEALASWVPRLQRKLRDAARSILHLRVEKEQLVELGNRLRTELARTPAKWQSAAQGSVAVDTMSAAEMLSGRESASSGGMFRGMQWRTHGRGGGEGRGWGTAWARQLSASPYRGSHGHCARGGQQRPREAGLLATPPSYHRPAALHHATELARRSESPVSSTERVAQEQLCLPFRSQRQHRSPAVAGGSPCQKENRSPKPPLARAAAEQDHHGHPSSSPASSSLQDTWRLLELGSSPSSPPSQDSAPPGHGHSPEPTCIQARGNFPEKPASFMGTVYAVPGQYGNMMVTPVLARCRVCADAAAPALILVVSGKIVLSVTQIAAFSLGLGFNYKKAARLAQGLASLGLAGCPGPMSPSVAFYTSTPGVGTPFSTLPAPRWRVTAGGSSPRAAPNAAEGT
ncbi:coiled-coil domain-containing protein 57 [Ctenodactylus gundi]